VEPGDPEEVIVTIEQIQIEIQHKRFVRAVRLWGFDEMEGRKIASFKNPTI